MAERQFPPQGYVPTKSALEGVMVYMPKPEIDDYEQRVEFACPNCGGVQAFNVSDGGLSCTSCGYYQPPTGAKVGRRASTNEFITEESRQAKADRLKRQLGSSLAAGAAVAGESADAASSATDSADLSTAETSALDVRAASVQTTPIGQSPASDEYDWGEDRNELECSTCGASILLDPKSLTHTCPFCGSSAVIQHAFDHDKMRPRYLIPFKVVTEDALKEIRQWLASSWMTPADLQQRAGLNELTGIYLPYWTFSAHTKADWRAQVGHTRTRTRDGKLETYTEWRWEGGNVSLPIRDLLVPGTGKLNQRLLSEMTHFNLNSLVEYEPSYIAGFNAQTYDINLDEAWATGRERMRDQTKSACYEQASTGKIRNFSMNMDFDNESWRYILLPVYLTTYRYQADTFSVMVNGQTGTIIGQRPIAWRKVGAAIAASFVPAILIALSALFFFEGEQSQNVLVVAGIFAALAVIISGVLGWTALNIRKAS